MIWAGESGCSDVWPSWESQFRIWKTSFSCTGAAASTGGAPVATLGPAAVPPIGAGDRAASALGTLRRGDQLEQSLRVLEPGLEFLGISAQGTRRKLGSHRGVSHGSIMGNEPHFIDLDGALFAAQHDPQFRCQGVLTWDCARQRR